MKEKAEILQQVDSLTQIKDELTSQVASLTTELEKERSKVHSLQNEHIKTKVIQRSSTASCVCIVKFYVYHPITSLSSMDMPRSHASEFVAFGAMGHSIV